MGTGPSTTWIQGPIFGGWNHEGWIYIMLYNDDSVASVSDKIDFIVSLQGLPGPLGAPMDPSYTQGVCGSGGG